MPRTKGATNRTPREIKKDGLFQLKLSKERARVAKLRKENASLKAKKKAK